MKKICLYVAGPYLENKIFDPSISPINRNDELSAYRELKDAFEKTGYILATQDINHPSESSAVIYNDMPLGALVDHPQSYLIAFECELIRPDNWSERRHRKFKKIFSLKLHDCPSTKSVKIQLPQQSKEMLNKTSWEEKKLCTVITGSHLSFHPKELYSERIAWIKWFTRNAPESFDFYGSSWTKRNIVGPRWLRALNKIPFWTKPLVPDLSLYKGVAQNKIETLNRYKFSLCFENAHSIPGYITEKIFDCFYAGNVPLYWGAPDIEKYIPKNCFIDVRNFKDKESLYNFMNKFTQEDYFAILKNIRSFLASSEAQIFSNQFFAETICSNVVNDLKLS